MTLPVLQAAPGFSGQEVARASTVALEPPSPARRHQYLQPAEPHLTRLSCAPGVAVDVGEGHFSVVELHHGTVHRLRATAHLAYLGVPEALALGDALVDRLVGAGFTVRERCADDVRAAEVASHEHTQLAELGAPYGSGGWRAEVWLRVAVRAGTLTARALALRGDGCLVTLVVHDRILGPWGAA